MTHAPSVMWFATLACGGARVWSSGAVGERGAQGERDGAIRLDGRRVFERDGTGVTADVRAREVVRGVVRHGIRSR